MTLFMREPPCGGFPWGTRQNWTLTSSTDFKLLFEKYQEDGIKQGISIVKYCQMNGIVYSHFERWYKKHRAGVVLPVEIVDESGLLDKSDGGSSSILSDNTSSSVASVTYVSIVFSNGLEVSSHNLSYQSLRGMIDKLEVLC